MPDLQDDHVILAKGLSQESALVLVSALAASGIDAFCKTENLGGYIPGGVSSIVFVQEKNLAAAHEVIGSQLPLVKAANRSTRPAGWRRSFRTLGITAACVLGAFLFMTMGFQAGMRFEARSGGSSASPKLQTDAYGRKYLEIDKDGDGFRETTEYYNDRGAVVMVKVDRNRDGFPDTILEYNEKGLLLRVSEDTNLDGKLDRWTDYGPGDKPIHESRDANFDGVKDTETEFDAYGQATKTIVSDKGKEIDRTYFKNGVATETHLDLRRSGKFDTLLRYDAFGVVREIGPYRP